MNLLVPTLLACVLLPVIYLYIVFLFITIIITIDKLYILLVDLLQREMGSKSSLRVVPLFETVADLQRAPTTLRELFSISYYHNRIQGEQVFIIYYKNCAIICG